MLSDLTFVYIEIPENTKRVSTFKYFCVPNKSYCYISKTNLILPNLTVTNVALELILLRRNYKTIK